MPEKKPSDAAPIRGPDAEPPPPQVAAAAPTKAPKEWAKAKGTPRWQLAAAAAGEVWTATEELSEQAFDAAITRALGAQSG